MLLTDSDADKCKRLLRNMRSSVHCRCDVNDCDCKFRQVVMISVGEVVVFCDGDVTTHDGEIIATFLD